MTVKHVVKRLLPPALLDLYVSVRKRFTTQAPAWHTVESGPLAGRELLLNTRFPAFAAMAGGTHDDFFWSYLSDHDLTGTTIVDVGGHVGYHALAFAALVGEAGSVLVFEPNASNLERIHRNLSRNPDLASRIDIRTHALGEHDGTTTFRTTNRVDDQTSSGGFISGSRPPLPEEAYQRAGFRESEIEVWRLDTVLSSLGGANPAARLGLIKIDVEGAETAVVRGAAKTIEHHRPLLLVETHTAGSTADVVQLLAAADYHVDVLEDGGMGRAFLGARPRG